MHRQVGVQVGIGEQCLSSWDWELGVHTCSWWAVISHLFGNGRTRRVQLKPEFQVGKSEPGRYPPYRPKALENPGCGPWGAHPSDTLGKF